MRQKSIMTTWTSQVLCRNPFLPTWFLPIPRNLCGWTSDGYWPWAFYLERVWLVCLSSEGNDFNFRLSLFLSRHLKPNNPNSNKQNKTLEIPVQALCLNHLSIWYLDLFRISIFGFRIYPTWILQYFEDLKRESNTGFEPKDIFEIGSNCSRWVMLHIF